MISMTPEYGPDDYTARTAFGLKVSGVPDMRQHKRIFSPDTIRLQFEYSSEHRQWKLNTWTVSGPVRLKSGELSQNSRAERYGWGWTSEEVPEEWISVAIQEYRPLGCVAFVHTGSDIGDE